MSFKAIISGRIQTGSLASGNVQDGILLQGRQQQPNWRFCVRRGKPDLRQHRQCQRRGNNGIYLNDGSWNTLQGNRVGTDATGTLNLGNSWNAIYLLNAHSNQIGGAVVGAGNLLSANGREGIDLVDSSWNVIQGNFIGTRPDGASALGNFLHGIDCLDIRRFDKQHDRRRGGGGGQPHRVSPKWRNILRRARAHRQLE